MEQGWKVLGIQCYNLMHWHVFCVDLKIYSKYRNWMSGALACKDVPMMPTIWNLDTSAAYNKWSWHISVSPLTYSTMWQCQNEIIPLFIDDWFLRPGTGISRISYLSEYPKGFPGNGSRRLGERGVSQTRSIFECPEDEGWCACMVSRFPGDGHALWPLFMAYIFLHPFDLAGHDSTHCHESQLERMRAKFGKSKTIYTAKDVSRKLPFLLSQSAILDPYTGLEPKDPLKFFPLEQTPLYTGTVTAYPKNKTGMLHDIGDVLVESFAWDSAMVSVWNASETNQDLAYLVQIPPKVTRLSSIIHHFLVDTERGCQLSEASVSKRSF